MAQMISDMLFLAKADNHLYEPNVVGIDLASEVHNLFDYYEAWADECGVSLHLSGEGTIQGDKLMIRRAISNLLSNAIRYTPKANTVNVILESSKRDCLAIVIENPGPDIAPEHLSRLFDRFYRVDSSRQRSREGAGLGLAIVKSIVDVHGGTIEVSSTNGITRFRIILPKKPKPM